MSKHPGDHRYFRFPSTADKIRSFALLEEGWYYGEGAAIQNDVVDTALDVYDQARRFGFFETDAFPGPGGQVRVTVYRDAHYLEFTIYPNLQIELVRELNSEEVVCREALEIQEVLDYLEQFHQELTGPKEWKQSEFSIPNTMTSGESVSRVWRSLIPVGVVVSPSLAQSVSVIEDLRFARTSGSTTGKFTPRRSYSGGSSPIYCLAAAD